MLTLSLTEHQSPRIREVPRTTDGYTRFPNPVLAEGGSAQDAGNDDEAISGNSGNGGNPTARRST
jgi:hypothetical protein